MSVAKEKFLPGPGCTDDDVCNFEKECIEARRIRDEMVKQQKTGVSTDNFQVLVSRCKSTQVTQAKREAGN